MARIALGCCCLLAGITGWLSGATTITGPLAGYATESSGTVLRAISGVPGSFRFSGALPLPEGVRRVHMAPGQDFALVERADSGYGILSLKAGAVDRLTVIAEAMATADWVVFSPTAGSAALFSSSTSRLQVLSGLPDTPRVAAELDTSTLPEAPLSAAVGDDGRVLLIASRRSVYLVPRDGAPELLMSARHIVSVAIFRNGTDAAVWDGGAGSVHLLRNVASAPVNRVLASGLKGLGKLYPSWDGESIFIMRRGAAAMSSIDVPSGEIQSFDSGAAPSTLDPLRNHDTFLISARPGQPGLIFYRDGSTARVVLVTPANPGTEDAQ